MEEEQLGTDLATVELRQSPHKTKDPFSFSLYSWFFTFLLYRHQNLNRMQRDLTCVNLSTWNHHNHSKQKQKSFFFIYNLTQHRHIMLHYVGCSFSLKQRKAIERKNGRVTAWNRPGNRGVKTVPTQNRGPFLFLFVFSVLHFFVVQTREFKPDAKRFNLCKSLHVET